MTGNATDGPDPQTPAPRDRLRLTAVVGALSALCVGACFFLPWVAIEKPLGTKFREDVQAAIERTKVTTRAQEDFEQLADTLATGGALAGTDLILWIRTAHAYNADLDAQAGAVSAADATLQRGLEIARAVFYALPVLGFLIGAYFLFHRFRRVRSPILILCVLTGTAALGLAAVLEFVHAQVTHTLGPVVEQVQKGAGFGLLLWGGAALALAGFFGVSARNWLRVYLGSAVTGVGLALLAWRFLVAGIGL